MTSQIQMLTTVPESSGVSTHSTKQESSSRVEVNAVGLSDRPSSNLPKQLPYQASHQVELLHLQAELDALFQQLQSLKQQRQTSPATQPDRQTVELPLLV
jgi:hypothetical protein